MVILLFAEYWSYIRCSNYRY